ncbi:MAG: hypothetical protein CMH54_13085 [Myxococcales bacterium]|nr:hypothetical protein [Myxococcales bacterium]
MRSNRQAGFSVLEMAVAMAIFSMVGLAMASAFQMVDSGGGTLRIMQDRMAEGRVAMHHLTRDLSMAYLSTHVPIDPVSKQPDKMGIRQITFFNGTSDSVDFTTLAHRRLVRGARESDQAQIGYYLDRVDGEPVLMRSVKSPLDDSDNRGEGFVVCRGVEEFKLEYWDARGGEKEGRWEDDWSAEQSELLESLEPQEGYLVDEEEAEQKLDLLPYRVRISLVLSIDDDSNVRFQAQTPIYLRRAFKFDALSKSGSSKGGSMPGSTPRTMPGGMR